MIWWILKVGGPITQWFSENTLLWNNVISVRSRDILCKLSKRYSVKYTDYFMTISHGLIRGLKCIILSYKYSLSNKLPMNISEWQRLIDEVYSKSDDKWYMYNLSMLFCTYLIHTPEYTWLAQAEKKQSSRQVIPKSCEVWVLAVYLLLLSHSSLHLQTEGTIPNGNN